MHWFYYHGSMFEPSALFFHPEIWGKYPIVFYFLLYDVVSKPFLRTAVSYLYWLLFPFLVFFGFCFFLQQLFLFLSYQDTGLDEVLLERMGMVPLVKLNFFVCFLSSLLQLFLTSRTFVVILWTQNYRRDVCIVYRHRLLTDTVATALSCSNNIQFGTRIVYCTKTSCICAERFLWSCFLRAQWLSVFNAVLPLPLGY